MKLNAGIHLAYCTNVHRGETWAETLGTLERHTLPVRQRVAAGKPYAIGLRLGQRAAVELSQPSALAEFQRWMEKYDCYVFTINGFPYGSFHGTRVKEHVYEPDWSTPERLAYTNLLFDLIAKLVPKGVEGSVSTVPGSFKAFVASEPARRPAIFANLTSCARHIEALAEKTGLDLHLGLEPEPLCLFETSGETVRFFDDWRSSDPAVAGLLRHVGVNYDCCHLAIEFEAPDEALNRIAAAGLRLSKLHLSSALRVVPDEAGRRALAPFVEPTYLHQVVAGRGNDVRRRFTDLPDALADAEPALPGDEWRVHFHIPLHAAPGAPFGDTRDHLLGALDWLAAHPGACTHLEMETYTWEVLPSPMRQSVEEQLVREYAYVLKAMSRRSLADRTAADGLPVVDEDDRRRMSDDGGLPTAVRRSTAGVPPSHFGLPASPQGLRRTGWRAGRPQAQSAARASLDLARAGNFPSVASNVMAALVLSAAAGPVWPAGGVLLPAIVAGCLAYAGGATFNDVMDAAFDARHRPERAIPSGVIRRSAAAWVGAVELALGLGLYLVAGASAVWAGALAVTILAYDWLHKRWSGSIFLMAGCRALLAVLIASMPGYHPGTAFWAWVGALFLYIVILSALARMEYRQGGEAAKKGKTIGRLLAFIPLIDAVALLIVGAWIPAIVCAAAVPAGKWAQKQAAAT